MGTDKRRKEREKARERMREHRKLSRLSECPILLATFFPSSCGRYRI